MRQSYQRCQSANNKSPYDWLCSLCDDGVKFMAAAQPSCRLGGDGNRPQNKQRRQQGHISEERNLAIAAEKNNIDVVLIDTAGRLHSNTNLMAELEKMMRVAKPDCKIFIGESITGNDCVEQAEKYTTTLGIDGIILTKADIDEMGGAPLSICYVTGKPILYLGMGQEYKDLHRFTPELILEKLGIK